MNNPTTKTQEKYEKECYTKKDLEECKCEWNCGHTLKALKEQEEELSNSEFIADLVKERSNYLIKQELQAQRQKFEEVLKEKLQNDRDGFKVDEFIKDVLEALNNHSPQNQVGGCDTLSDNKAIVTSESKIAVIEDKTPSSLTNPTLDVVSRTDEDRGSNILTGCGKVIDRITGKFPRDFKCGDLGLNNSLLFCLECIDKTKPLPNICANCRKTKEEHNHNKRLGEIFCYSYVDGRKFQPRKESGK